MKKIRCLLSFILVVALMLGTDYAGKVVRLTADLDFTNLTSENFTMVGSLNRSFNGTFDGVGYSIKGLNCNFSASRSEPGHALFYQNEWTIKNLVLKDSDLQTTSGFFGRNCSS